MAVLIEVGERVLTHEFSLDLGSVVEIVAGAVLIPATAGAILAVLEHNAFDPLTAVRQLKLGSALNQQLSGAHGWSDLIRVIVDFPRKILPVMRCTLVLFDPASAPLTPDGQGFWYSLSPPAYRPASADRLELTCAAMHESRKFRACECPLVRSPNAEVRGYCIPLMNARQPVALLHLYTAPDRAVTKDQMTLLESVAPVLALAIENAHSKQVIELIQEQSDAELKRIGRDLHDNLAQDLLYVGLKLEQLIGNESKEEIAASRADLRRMRAVVNAAHSELRDALKGIQDSGLADVTAMLQGYADSVKDRLGFSIMFTVSGQAERMPTRSARQVLSIFREVLTNVQKHAGAGTVEVALAWEADGLTLSVMDDGRGFEPNQEASAGRLGIGILRERAEVVKGKLTVESSPGGGTRVTLWVPKGRPGHLPL